MQTFLRALEGQLVDLMDRTCFAEAVGDRGVHDGEWYPHLVRVHGIGDLMNVAVPSDLQRWVRQIFALAPAVNDDGSQRLLGP
jgi:hypothetical protein